MSPIKDRHKAEAQNKETMWTNINDMDMYNQLLFVNNVQEGLEDLLSKLGGILNILRQSEEFEEAESRNKALESDNISSKAKMEALESWVIKQNSNILKLTDRWT